MAIALKIKVLRRRPSHRMSLFHPPFAAGPGEDEVERVICASLAANRDNIYATMEEIRECALRHNPAARIHVALIYQSGWFLHWAEGPREAVNALFQRISLDDRHHSQYVVHHSRGRRLLMTAWSMMLSSSTESAADFGGRVMHLRAEIKAGRQFAPDSAIRRLTAPMRLAQALRLPDPESFNRVGVCSALGNGAFDLVHWLAEKHHEPIARRRLAGEADLDSGGELVDFMRRALPCRVIAVARADLTHGLRRVLMQDWQFLVLLFSGVPKRDIALLERVREALHDLPRIPDLVAFAPDAATRDQMERAARASDLPWLHGDVRPAHDCEAIWHAIDARLDQIGDPPSSVWAVSESSLVR